MISGAGNTPPVCARWSRSKPGPERKVSTQPCWPQKHAGPGRSSSLGQDSELCPHSPAMALGPVRTEPRTTIPPPTPVPRMTPNTTSAPAAAPSVASDNAKQLASLVMRTSRCSRSDRSPTIGATVEADGVGPAQEAGGARYGSWRADADRPGRMEASLSLADQLRDSIQNAVVVGLWRRCPPAQEFASIVAKRDDFDLGSAKVDAQAHQLTAAPKAHAKGIPAARARLRSRPVPSTGSVDALMGYRRLLAGLFDLRGGRQGK